jgi:hypothetical protein
MGSLWATTETSTLPGGVGSQREVASSSGIQSWLTVNILPPTTEAPKNVCRENDTEE